MVTDSYSIANKVRSFKDLEVYQLSLELAKNTYLLVDTLPKKEKFIISEQLLRAVNSIGANIAEGHGRYSAKEFIKFLYISRGSLNEALHFLILSCHLGYIDGKKLEEFNDDINRLGVKLNNLISAISKKQLVTTNNNK